jgi:phosphohistidine phosphatase
MPQQVSQSGVIPFRQGDAGLEILIISTRTGHWGIPKGTIEPGLSAIDSAAKEALEEAGIEGMVMPDAIGTYTMTKWDTPHTVQLYLMEITTIHDHWEEEHIRERRLMPAPAASRAVWHPDVARMILDVPAILEGL